MGHPDGGLPRRGSGPSRRPGNRGQRSSSTSTSTASRLRTLPPSSPAGTGRDLCRSPCRCSWTRWSKTRPRPATRRQALERVPSRVRRWGCQAGVASASAGSLTPAGGASSQSNTGGCDQERAPLKLTVLPENSAPPKPTLPLENTAPLENTRPPAMNSAPPKPTVPPENTAP
jgi:hypothetical protein